MDSLGNFPHPSKPHAIFLFIDRTINTRQEIRISENKELEMLKGYHEKCHVEKWFT